MGKFTKPIDLYHAQRARFERLKLSMRVGHMDLAQSGLEDMRELTAGSLGPDATKGAFARQRLASGAVNPMGARSLLSKGQMQKRGLVSQVPLLPINIQSNALHSSIKIQRGTGGTQCFLVGAVNPGGGGYRLLPGGTFKMVDSGFEAEVRRRWKARNKAFLDHYRASQQKP